ncbi:hypothetical protein ACWDKQ_10250 [Saccharopolyspora sp. NPDC000995]
MWTTGGPSPQRDPGEPLYAMMAVLDDAGYTSVVATYCEQNHHRYLRHGEWLAVSTRLDRRRRAETGRPLTAFLASLRSGLVRRGFARKRRGRPHGTAGFTRNWRASASG